LCAPGQLQIIYHLEPAANDPKAANVVKFIRFTAAVIITNFWCGFCPQEKHNIWNVQVNYN